MRIISCRYHNIMYMYIAYTISSQMKVRFTQSLSERQDKARDSNYVNDVVAY